MFNFSFDKRIIYIIIGIMILSTLVNYVSNPGALVGLLISIPGVLIAITFHEFAHAYAADKLGDDTARREGRLSLNPKDHLDPIGSLLLLFAGFGWGKPVRVNPLNYTRKFSMEKGEAIVSVAGPLMNFILAFVFAIIMWTVAKITGTVLNITTFGLMIGSASTTVEIIIKILFSTISINIGLGVFNLIPLPPLDGSKIIMPFLPTNAKSFFINNESIFYIIFVVIWITGLAGIIISPPINWITSGILSITKLIFGL